MLHTHPALPVGGDTISCYYLLFYLIQATRHSFTCANILVDLQFAELNLAETN